MLCLAVFQVQCRVHIKGAFNEKTCMDPHTATEGAEELERCSGYREVQEQNWGVKTINEGTVNISIGQ